jgi:hypothetical protein
VDVEAETLRMLVVPERRARWVEGLGNPKRRRKVLARLSHHYDWVERYAVPIKPSGDYSEQVERLADEMRRRGAPETCHVLAPHDLDGQTVPLTEALNTFVVWGDALLICIPGVLALHLPEAPEPPLILDARTTAE